MSTLALLCVGCPLPDVEIWCGYEWKAQVSGAFAYDTHDMGWPILASSTTHAACFTMREDYYLDEADGTNPAYVALRTQLESGAIANCELAGATLLQGQFDYTDCATAGTPPVQVSVFTNDESCHVLVTPDRLELAEICEDYYDCQSGETGWDCADSGETGGAEPIFDRLTPLP